MSNTTHDNHEAMLYTILCNARERVKNRETMDPYWVLAIVDLALVDICAKLGGRPEGDDLDDYAVFAFKRAHQALTE